MIKKIENNLIGRFYKENKNDSLGQIEYHNLTDARIGY